MNALDVLDGGLLTTVQDLGRTGWQRSGVPVSGAMDDWALRAANRLVGNAEGAAALEMTLAGPTLRIDGDGVVAITGADLGACLNGRPLPLWQAVAVCDGAELAFSGRRTGMRAYLAVAGGIDVPPVLGSRSTFTRAGLGGFKGRALAAGDCVPVGPCPCADSLAGRRLPRDVVPRFAASVTVRVVMGPQDSAFTAAGIKTFLSEPFTLTAQSDRVGCRLSGPPIAHIAGADIVSDGTVCGAVQVSGDGMPIVLLADRGTTGGYTKIATVVTADVPILAQAAPGDRVRFAAVGIDAAHALLRLARERLDRIGPAEPAAAPSPEIFEEDSGSSFAAAAYADLAGALGVREAGPAARGDAVRAAMPGVVVSVGVAPGDMVAAGQPLLVVEAMKMQSPVRAPRGGRVARVLVEAGTQIEGGAALVEFEAAARRKD